MNVSIISAILLLIAGLPTLASSSAKSSEEHVAPSAKPNILLIVADDLGMFDIGSFGSEIRTPNIDALAKQGVRYSQFYTSATCSPTRAMLLSGVDNHTAGLGNMAEHLAPNQRTKPGYEGHLSNKVVSVATLLKDAGYRTYMAGKWHLGGQDHLLPDKRGFDQSFVLLQGGASYFNDMMGLTSKVPKGLYRHNGKQISALPEDFYASEFYADFMIDQIGEEQSPFFAYLAFTAPHWPLQVKDEHLDLYKGKYKSGYDNLHADRIKSAIKRGVLKPHTKPANRAQHVMPWSELPQDKQKHEARTMEIYAAVVERMDFHLGRVLAHLEKTRQRDNTVIIFMSDNGADGSDRSKLPGNDKWLPEVWDLSYDNMGKRGSYVYPGPGWARASAGPLKLYKEFVSEGGIRSPAIISYANIARRGEVSSALMTVQDIAPTILDFAGVKAPITKYQGRDIEPMSGVSLKPFLEGQIASPYKNEQAMVWELFGHRAVRKGDWKLLWLSSKPKWLSTPESSDQWALYNLAQDPSEDNNLANSEPDKLNELIEHWQTYAKEKGVILPQWD